MTIEIFDRQVSASYTWERDDAGYKYASLETVEYKGRDISNLLSKNTLKEIEEKLQDKL
jgi:hypothetical protein